MADAQKKRDVEPVPVEEEARRRAEEDALEQAYEPGDGQPAVDEAHADDEVAEELAKDAVRDLTEGDAQSQRNR